MGYVAVKGGTQAIAASIERLAWERLKHGVVLRPEHVRAGMRALIDQVMSEASLYSEHVASLAIKQAEGSPEEAVFIMRAFRSTLPRTHYSFNLESERMRVERRISATFKEIPGGQILGASYDYTHRLIDADLADETDEDAERWLREWYARATGAASTPASDAPTSTPAGDAGASTPASDAPTARTTSTPAGDAGASTPASDATTAWTTSTAAGDAAASTPASDAASDATTDPAHLPKVIDYLRRQGLMKPVHPDDTPPRDVTKEALAFPSTRSQRLQILTRGQTGAVTALGYASLRGFGPLLHPTVAELRVGRLAVTVPNPFGDGADEEDGYFIGEIKVTEVESVVPVGVPRGQGRTEIEFDLGYGICYGQNETKAIAMSLLDQCLEHPDPGHPTHDEEFVLLHVDSVEATGFISHLKLPHYVTFQSELDAVRKSRRSEQASLADREVELPGGSR